MLNFEILRIHMDYENLDSRQNMDCAIWIPDYSSWFHRYSYMHSFYTLAISFTTTCSHLSSTHEKWALKQICQHWCALSASPSTSIESNPLTLSNSNKARTPPIDREPPYHCYFFCDNVPLLLYCPLVVVTLPLLCFFLFCLAPMLLMRSGRSLVL